MTLSKGLETLFISSGRNILPSTWAIVSSSKAQTASFYFILGSRRMEVQGCEYCPLEFFFAILGSIILCSPVYS